MATTSLNPSPSLPSYDELLQVQKTAPISRSSNAMDTQNAPGQGSFAGMQADSSAVGLSEDSISSSEAATMAMAASGEEESAYVGTQLSVYA